MFNNLTKRIALVQDGLSPVKERLGSLPTVLDNTTQSLRRAENVSFEAFEYLNQVGWCRVILAVDR